MMPANSRSPKSIEIIPGRPRKGQDPMISLRPQGSRIRLQVYQGLAGSGVAARLILDTPGLTPGLTSDASNTTELADLPAVSLRVSPGSMAADLSREQCQALQGFLAKILAGKSSNPSQG